MRLKEYLLEITTGVDLPRIVPKRDENEKRQVWRVEKLLTFHFLIECYDNLL